MRAQRAQVIRVIIYLLSREFTARSNLKKPVTIRSPKLYFRLVSVLGWGEGYRMPPSLTLAQFELENLKDIFESFDKFIDGVINIRNTRILVRIHLSARLFKALSFLKTLLPFENLWYRIIYLL